MSIVRSRELFRLCRMFSATSAATFANRSSKGFPTNPTTPDAIAKNSSFSAIPSIVLTEDSDVVPITSAVSRTATQRFSTQRSWLSCSLPALRVASPGFPSATPSKLSLSSVCPASKGALSLPLLAGPSEALIASGFMPLVNDAAVFAPSTWPPKLAKIPRAACKRTSKEPVMSTPPLRLGWRNSPYLHPPLDRQVPPSHSLQLPDASRD